MTENHLWHIELLLLVHDHRHTFSIVPHFDDALGRIDADFDLCDTLRIPLYVIDSIDNDLIEYLVQAWHIGDLFLYHSWLALICIVDDPHQLAL